MKILIIDNCNQCPFKGWDKLVHKSFCELKKEEMGKRRIAYQIKEIPEWCPLPDIGAVLLCNQCGNTETPPYADGDACYCGGVFVELPQE